MKCYNIISKVNKTYLESHCSSNWLIPNNSLKRSLASRAVGGEQKTVIQTVLAKIVTTHRPHRIGKVNEAYRAVFYRKVSAHTIKISLTVLETITQHKFCDQSHLFDDGAASVVVAD